MNRYFGSYFFKTPTDNLDTKLYLLENNHLFSIPTLEVDPFFQENEVKFFDCKKHFLIRTSLF